MEMEWNKTKWKVHVRQLFSEHFDFALSQLNSQCTKSSESDKELSYLLRVPYKRCAPSALNIYGCLLEVHACIKVLCIYLAI